MDAVAGQDPGFTPGRRRGVLSEPVPREDGCVYVRVEVQFPGGRGVILTRRELPPEPDTLNYRGGDLASLALTMLAEANAHAVRTVQGL